MLIRIDIDLATLKKSIDKLPVKERLKLFESLQESTWGQRFKRVASRIQSRYKSQHRSISDEDIQRIVKRVRKRHYAKGRH